MAASPNRAGPPAKPDPRQLEALRTLGYTGGDADASGTASRQLADNRDRASLDERQRWLEAQNRARAPRPPSREGYAPIHENPFVVLSGDPLSGLSTFGVDVDTASYANVRRFLTRNQAPPPDAVRLEELINYFDYDLPGPDGQHPFAVTVDVTEAPWAPAHRLVRIGLQGERVVREERPASNLVFLVDVSGSMQSADKLPLLVQSLKALVNELDERDRVALVTYASGTAVVLPSTSGAQKDTIRTALDGLRASGSTHGSAGIQRAYEVATEHFLDGGVNRVLLATDGDFNVGVTSRDALHGLITDKARSGVFLTVLGFGTGNLQDGTAELLADKGNGQYAYIDSFAEARKVLVEELGATLVTIAKDVKLQVEFNPGRVAAYRLLGYENRALAARDFRDDTKDAGEIGAGHSVTALYEVIPVGVASLAGTADLRYRQPAPEPETVVESDELLTVNLRYKQPDGATGIEFSVPVIDGDGTFAAAHDDTRFAAAVAAFGMVLRGSAHRGDVDLERIAAWADGARGEDARGLRREFVDLVRRAQGIPGLR